MKIGIFSDELNNRWTGIGTYTYQLIEGLAGQDSTEICLINSKYNILWPQEQITIPNPFPAFKKYLWYPYAVHRLKNFNLDIIHNPTQIPTYFKFVQKNVITIHDLTPKICPAFHAFTTTLDFNILIPRTLMQADGIIADSWSTKSDLVKYLNQPPERIRVIHIAANEAYKPLSADNTRLINWKMRLPEKFILFVGKLEPRKNITTLILAYHLCMKNGFHHKLVIIGKKGWKYQNIFRLVDDLHLQKHIVFMENLTVDDLCSCYNLADVFVYPSIYEGFGLPPLEAMSCGCPVITSNTSSLPEVVGDAGIMVDPHDAKGLAEKIKVVINDLDLKERMISLGIKQAKSFSWKRCISETKQVYESCLHA